MPHARKPSKRQQQQTVSSPLLDSKQKHIRLEDESNNNNNNQKNIQIQTKIERLAKNMNRPSVFFNLDADDFKEKFTECWKEHIEGFVGLRGAKRERTDKEKKMEWRQRVKDLPKIKKNVQVRKSGQTVSEKERLLVVQRYRDLMASKKKS